MSESDNPLAIPELVADGEFRTLASIAWDGARQPRGGDGVAKTALAALAEATTAQDAFPWLWTLLTRIDGADGIPATLSVSVWNLAAESLPEKVVIPKALHDEIKQFLALPQPEGTSPEQHHETFRIALLERSSISVTARRNIAQDLMENGLDVATPIGKAAFDLLAESGQKTRQPLLIKSVDALSSAQQVDYLRRVPVAKRTPDLHAAIVSSLTAENLASNAAATRRAVAALSELPAPEMANVAASPWATASIEPLRSSKLALELEPATLRVLVSAEAVDSAITSMLIDQARELPPDRMTEWAPWLYGQDPDAARALVDHLVEKVSAASEDERDRTLAGIIEKLATDTEDAALASALPRLYDTVGTLKALRRGSPSPAQQGRILAAAADKAGEYESELYEHVELADDEHLAPMLSELLTRLTGDEHTDLVVDLCLHAFTTDAALLAALSTDHRSKVISAVKVAGPDGCLQLLALELEASQLTSEEVREISPATHWTKATADQYRRYVNRLAVHWPDELVHEAGQAIDSLDKPQAEAIKDSHLAPLLGQVLDLELGEELADGSPERFERAFKARGETRRLACRWSLQLQPTPDRVDALVAAHAGSAKWEDEFREARRDFADRLSATVLDQSEGEQSRTAAMELASNADVEVARGTAMQVLEDEHNYNEELRIASATVLVDGGIPADRVDDVKTLIDREEARAVRELLEMAQRRVKSGTTGEALRNLFDLAGLDPQDAPSVAVALPLASMHDAFGSAVDRARASEPGPIENHVTDLVSVMEVIVDTAVVAYFDVHGKGIRSQQVELLREGAANRPDLGALTVMQSLTDKALPWLSAVSTLVDNRFAHAREHGSNKPRKAPPNLRETSRGLLGLIVDGWANSMEELAAEQATRADSGG